MTLDVVLSVRKNRRIFLLNLSLNFFREVISDFMSHQKHEWKMTPLISQTGILGFYPGEQLDCSTSPKFTHLFQENVFFTISWS